MMKTAAKIKRLPFWSQADVIVAGIKWTPGIASMERRLPPDQNVSCGIAQKCLQGEIYGKSKTNS